MRQTSLQPQLDAPGPNQRRRKIADVHRRHHEADATGARALEPIEHREEETVQARLLACLEDHIAVVDEDDRRRVPLRELEDVMDVPVEMRRSADDGAI